MGARVSRLSITHTQCVKGRVKDHAWRLNRSCACGAAIRYEAPKHTKFCAYCRTTRKTREYRQAHPEAKMYGKRDKKSCKRCGIDAAGKTRCARCQQAHTDKVRAMKAKRKAAGLCTACGIAPATNGQLCKEHALKEKKAWGEARMLAIAQGKCGRCRKRKRVLGHVHCEACMAIKRQQNRRAA